MPNAHAKSQGRSTDHGSRIATARLSVPHPCRQRNLSAACLQDPNASAGASESRADVSFDALIADGPEVRLPKRTAGVRGDLDHFGAMGALQGLLIVLRDAGHSGLLVVLDEVETLQRVRGDVRDKGLMRCGSWSMRSTQGAFRAST
jgi:P-loop Domain of unknown function (DUF2791)